MDLERSVRAAAGGDLDAFAELTRRFQHMAFGYALSFVRDLGQAEDVVQEAFVAAWYALPTLADPAAFAGWLRGIVRHRAHRVLRRKHFECVPLTDADTVATSEPTADRRVERRQEVGAVLAAIAALPRPLREVITLYYVHDCSHQDIATFLGVPVTTVNNRLHAARAQLKRRTLTMVKDTLEAHRLPDDFAARIGHIVSARDGVVDARFDPVSLPDFLTELVASDEAHQRAVSLQVVQRRPDGIVRCIVTSPADALEPGMTVLSAGRHVQKPVSREVFDRSVRLLAGPSASPDAPVEMLATGIKVIDVMCPLVRGGTVAIAGELRAGTTVIMEELVRRLSGGLAGLAGVDVVIRMSAALAARGIYPPVDPLTSRSRLLESESFDPAHRELAARIRGALGALLAPAADTPPADALTLEGAEKLLRFFAQPFYVAEPYTKRPGVTVGLAESLRVCREILDGVHDSVSAKAFYFTGVVGAVMEQARTR